MIWALIRRASAMLLALALVACGEETTQRRGTTANGTYVVSYAPVPEPIPFAELFALDVSVNDAAGAPADGTSLALEVAMPAHGHGMQTVPTISSTAPGRFRVEGMKFHMRGTWQLEFTVDGPKGRASVVLEEVFE